MKFILHLLDYLEEGVMVIGLGIMVVLNFVNVICRYLMPQTPFSYTEELNTLIFVWITVFGIAYGYKRGSHTGLTLITDRLPKIAALVVLVIGTLCSVAFMGIVFSTSCRMVSNQIEYGNIFPGIGISAAWGGVALPLGALLTIIRAIEACITNARKLFKKEVEL